MVQLDKKLLGRLPDLGSPGHWHCVGRFGWEHDLLQRELPFPQPRRFDILITTPLRVIIGRDSECVWGNRELLGETESLGRDERERETSTGISEDTSSTFDPPSSSSTSTSSLSSATAGTKEVDECQQTSPIDPIDAFPHLQLIPLHLDLVSGMYILTPSHQETCLPQAQVPSPSPLHPSRPSW